MSVITPEPTATSIGAPCSRTGSTSASPAMQALPCCEHVLPGSGQRGATRALPPPPPYWRPLRAACLRARAYAGNCSIAPTFTTGRSTRAARACAGSACRGPRPSSAGAAASSIVVSSAIRATSSSVTASSTAAAAIATQQNGAWPRTSAHGSSSGPVREDRLDQHRAGRALVVLVDLGRRSAPA